MEIKVPFREILCFCSEKSEGELAGHCFCAEELGWDAEGPSSHSSFPLNPELDISSLSASLPHLTEISSTSAFILASADQFRQHTLQDSTTVASHFGNTHKIAITLFLGGTISH